MKIAITGGTGFIGNHLIAHLLTEGHQILVTGTSIEKAKTFSWFNNVQFYELDITKNVFDETLISKILECDKLIHLAWSGLPNYKDSSHIERNLMPQYFFIKQLISLGLRDITITGTCFEYGIRNGGLSTSEITNPNNAYAIAKDSLRKFVENLFNLYAFNLKWVRLFYIYGPGQSDSSLYTQLNKALLNNEKYFNMSGGEQLRDFLPIKDVVSTISKISIAHPSSGIFNCCSGKPVSVRSFVENLVKESGKKIDLNLGFFPYNEYEPMAFWGIPSDIQ